MKPPPPPCAAAQTVPVPEAKTCPCLRSKKAAAWLAPLAGPQCTHCHQATTGWSPIRWHSDTCSSVCRVRDAMPTLLQLSDSDSSDTQSGAGAAGAAGASTSAPNTRLPSSMPAGARPRQHPSSGRAPGPSRAPVSAWVRAAPLKLVARRGSARNHAAATRAAHAASVASRMRAHLPRRMLLRAGLLPGVCAQSVR